MLNGNISEVVSEPNWINVVLFANIPHMLVVTIGEAFVLFIWIFPTMLAGILLNVDIFTYFNSIFLKEACITDDGISSGVKGIVEQVPVAHQMSPPCVDLYACDVLSLPVEPES